ncbi:MAG TPA: hypothetical protein VEX36_01685 [Thermoleophilaceae bacterium]|nr:hypothetical protein [Thermoleophilaceae bacterium]
MSSAPGTVITFYSYKGGTGRTMALANAAVLLARRGSGDVLMIDWDLEAPGLHEFFRSKRLPLRPDDVTPGLLELFEKTQNGDRGSLWGNSGKHATEAERFWRETPLDAYIAPTDESSLFLMKAGRLDDDYAQRVNAFDWERLFERAPDIFTAFADELARRFRYVLVDSRTGLTDTGGICTSLLPERLVVVFTPNRQSLDGGVKLARDATTYRSNSRDLRPLLVFPLASRVETSEDELRQEWRYGNREMVGYQPRFERLFEEVYDLPRCHLEPYFDEVQIQHATRYAYGESIAVREEQSDRLSLSRSYERFTRELVGSSGPWAFTPEQPVVSAEDVRKRSGKVRERVSAAERYHASQARIMRRADIALRVAQAIPVVVAAALIGYGSSTAAQPGVGAIVSFVVVVAGVLYGTELIRRALAYRARYVLHARTANALARETSYFEGGAGPYRSSVRDPVVLLNERVADVLAEAEDALIDARLG